MPQPGEAFEGPQLQHLIEQECARRATRSAGVVEETQEHVERLAGACRRPLDVPGKRRRGDHRLEKALRRGGAALDVDVLRGAAADAVAHSLQQPRAAGAATPWNYWNA